MVDEARIKPKFAFEFHNYSYVIFVKQLILDDNMSIFATSRFCRMSAMIMASYIAARTGMIEFFKHWIEHRRSIRRRWQADARWLVDADPVGAYYEAQRRALRSRAQGNSREHWHWAKVASEVARIEPRAEMYFKVVRRIADQEDTAPR